MVIRRFHLAGVVAVLLALVMRLVTASDGPKYEAMALAGNICRSDSGDSGGVPAPSHPADCPACPLCGTLHTAPHISEAASPPPILPPRFPTSATHGLRVAAPPSRYRQPDEPRAPPIAS